MNEMRFALIGCGEIGGLRAEALQKSPGLKLVRACDVDAARGKALAAQHGVPYESDWHAALGDDVDAVLVSTPPPLHTPMCLEAFRLGKHVLCEKPLARSPEEGRQIVEAARAAKRHLATGFNYRFYPAIAAAKSVLDSGRIGELDHIRSYAGHPGGTEFTHAWVHDVKVMGGGALVDNGIHILDLTRYFLGEVVEVKGFRTGHVWSFEGCEDNAFALLRNSRGNIAQLQASWSEWRGYRFRIEVYGTRGCVRASYPPMYADAVWSEKPGGPMRRERFFFPALQIKERLKSYRFTVVQSFIEEFAGFLRAAQGQATPAASGHDGLRAVEIAHAVYQSSADGGTVLFPA
ncbi:MAG: Gfo/Idh/MocA family oxidoreductase [Acidipila sp.]|nr:Gfo/Idh/MocA family oxidoreductase [Acidipila sp.]